MRKFIGEMSMNAFWMCARRQTNKPALLQCYQVAIFLLFNKQRGKTGYAEIIICMILSQAKNSYKTYISYVSRMTETNRIFEYPDIPMDYPLTGIVGISSCNSFIRIYEQYPQLRHHRYFSKSNRIYCFPIFYYVLIKV